jgi:hypothetical protein
VASLVKWFLAIPYYVVLAFLWIGAVIAIIIAWFAILFTGPIPSGAVRLCRGCDPVGNRVTAHAFPLATGRHPRSNCVHSVGRNAGFVNRGDNMTTLSDEITIHGDRPATNAVAELHNATGDVARWTSYKFYSFRPKQTEPNPLPKY